MPTRFHFEKGHTLTVEEDVEAVQNAFRTVEPHPAPLAVFTKQGRKVFVNVARVSHFTEYRARARRATGH